ncbi:uncharacterized protein LOC132931333 isoform X2 [Rhopalosiphum padi]|nr:uncharacterized protein LOC132931331 isoform X2 [Rhopalosiphum padi]XP_060853373.1 uncharacterized protein LOC132931333 isoform X2 [Rhopalosiphum padi]
MRVLKKGLTDEELVELLDWNISDDDQDGSDIEDLDDLNDIVELFDNDEIPLIINNDNEVTNDLDILNLPVDFGETQLDFTERSESTYNLPTENQPNNVTIQSRSKDEQKLLKNKLSKLNWKEPNFCPEPFNYVTYMISILFFLRMLFI